MRAICRLVASSMSKSGASHSLHVTSGGRVVRPDLSTNESLATARTPHSKAQREKAQAREGLPPAMLLTAAAASSLTVVNAQDCLSTDEMSCAASDGSRYL